MPPSMIPCRSERLLLANKISARDNLDFGYRIDFVASCFALTRNMELSEGLTQPQPRGYADDVRRTSWWIGHAPRPKSL